MAGTEENPIVYPTLVMPQTVERETVKVWSLGLALGLTKDDKLPAVVMSHGVGGDKLTCERYAAKFAEAGMIAISFSQASWGESQGRLMLVNDEASTANADGTMTAKVRMASELLDPVEWVDCFRAATDYLEGEPHVDVNRIGAWGTSFGGGTAFYSTAEDSRIKALVTQVAAIFNTPPDMQPIASARARQIARGETPPIPQGPPDMLPNLPGTPHFGRFLQYKVGDQANKVNVPTMLLVAENEEMFDNNVSAGAAYKRLEERGVEAYYEVLPDIDHYGIYFGGYERGSQLALDWFLKHL
jgi:dienelactone hydrolase